MKEKKKGRLGQFLHKKENIAIMLVAMVFCAGVVVTNIRANKIPLHDGDVLVDSQNIAAQSETADPAEATSGDSTEKAGESAFAEKRAALELERNDLIARYDDTIKNSGNEAEKKNAVAQKEKLSGYMEQEVAIEGILRTKNLPECLVILTDSTVTVTVDQQDLKQNTVAKICSIVMEETGRSADRIVIQSSY